MTTELDIANRALGLVRARTVLSSLVGLDPEIVAVNQFLGPTRDLLLRSFDWNFTRDFASLNLLKTSTGGAWDTSQPRPPWQYQYAVPSNCITVRYILGQPITAATTPIFPTGSEFDASDAMYYKWELVSEAGVKKIVTDAPNALCCFTKEVSDPTLWDYDFTEVVVTLLASRLAIPLSGDMKLATQLQNIANMLLQEAKANSANEGIDIVENNPDVLTARRSYGVD